MAPTNSAYPLLHRRAAAGDRLHALADRRLTGAVPGDEQAAQRDSAWRLSDDPLLIRCHDQAFDLCGQAYPSWSGGPSGADRRWRIPLPVRLPVREDTGLVAAANGTPPGDDEPPYRDRPQIPIGQTEHDLLIRPRRPRVRGGVRERQARRLCG